MIFYFSGTGNSLAAARIIAEETGDMLVSIGAACKYKDFDFTLEQEEPLGFVFPTYDATTPAIVDEFVRRANFRTGNKEAFAPCYCFAVVTCGGLVGNTARSFAKRLLRRQGINLDASFSVRSVGNCAYLYDPAQGEERAARLAQADAETRRIALRVKAREQVRAERRHPFGMLMSLVMDRDEKACSTKKFHTLPTCIGCGQCADLCPTNTITLIEGTPRWAEMGCTRCLACLHRCPTSAIQYGKSTEARSRYTNPVLVEREDA